MKTNKKITINIPVWSLVILAIGIVTYLIIK